MGLSAYSMVEEYFSGAERVDQLRDSGMGCEAACDEINEMASEARSTAEEIAEVKMGDFDKDDDEAQEEAQDEFDTEPPELVKIGEDTFQVSGSLLVAELEAELGLELSDRDEDTIAGVALSELGRRARVGDKVRLGSIELEVDEIEGNRIVSLKLAILGSSKDEVQRA